MAELKQVEQTFRHAVDSKAMPGIVVAAATDRGLLYEGAFGVRELGKAAAMTPDTVVWIASMTKAITATAAMQLVERGKIALDRPPVRSSRSCRPCRCSKDSTRPASHACVSLAAP